jgi:hypothetical protein
MVLASGVRDQRAREQRPEVWQDNLFGLELGRREEDPHFAVGQESGRQETLGDFYPNYARGR